MKKNLFFFGLAVLISASLVSCKKDDNNKDTTVKASLVKTISFDAAWAGGVERWEFFYDATSGKVTSFDNYWDGTLDKTILYDYTTAGKLTLTRDGSTYASYDINDKGYITKEDWGGGEYAAYEYNADGYLVKVIEHWGDADHLKYQMTITNGNITKITTFDDDGVTVKKEKEFFYTIGDNVNNIHQANAVDSDWKTMGNFYGKPSKKLVDHFDYWDPRVQPISKSTSSLTYEFDAKNRPSVVTKVLTDLTTEVWSYTYYED
ncbi:MAG: hypothetical protein H6538_00825 [Bacteroidales bacterium]|nr:hypothetical protein [Bacteroidales bacterium]MCB9012585.1 hypothetical protein [Bacteroidales bacterium]